MAFDFQPEKEGVIKFQYDWVKTDPPSRTSVAELELLRGTLYKLKFIGVDQTGLGYGNVSRLLKKHEKKNEFIITGSQTGGKPALLSEDYCRITDYDFSRFWVKSEGKIKPSSESLTHASLYDADPEIQWIIHIHNLELWNYMRKHGYTETGNITYGTREMAEEVGRLYRSKKIKKGNLLAMTGHESGIISFGKTSRDALSCIYDLMKSFGKL
ncbi:MAG: class II aldolase/adducin family protein [Spirochaetia bacterium]|nr:class II aldolase/adducin family protein [Spirochaetia bacterium]